MMMIKNFKDSKISKKDRKRFNRSIHYIEYSLHIIIDIDDYNDKEMLKINAIKNFRKSFEFILELLNEEEFNRLIEERDEFKIAYSFYERLIKE